MEELLTHRSQLHVDRVGELAVFGEPPQRRIFKLDASWY